MEFQCTHTDIAVHDLIFDAGVEQAVDCDVTLPEYCPDILRILKCQMTPYVHTFSITGDRLSVEGAAVIRIFYVDEECKMVRCFEQSCPFTRAVELKATVENPEVLIRPRVEYVNCRAITQRRADVHGAISIHIKVGCKKNEQLLVDAEGAGVQLRQKTLSCTHSVGDTERGFALNETVELGQSNPPVRYLVRSSARAVVNDLKIITNKILIKGELQVKILYCSDEKEEQLEMVENSIQISQIVDLEGIDENCACQVNLRVGNLEVQPKGDVNGEMRMLDVNAKVCAQIHACRTEPVSVVTDAYSTEYETECPSKKMDLSSLYETLQDSTLCKDSLDLSEFGVNKIFDIWCDEAASSVSKQEDALLVTGTLKVCFLFLDKDDHPNFCERPMDFEYRKAIPIAAEGLFFDPVVEIRNLDYSILNQNNIDVRVELKISGNIMENHPEQVVGEIQPNEERPKEASGAALTIYFCDAGEDVWNIARRYNTTMEAILAENDLSGDVIPEKTMLLIPSV